MSDAAIEEQPSEAEVVQEIEVRRFGLPDLEPKGLWLHTRLQSVYPDIAPNHLAAWLRCQIESNDFLFLTAPHAVGMAQIGHRPLQPLPTVEEVFVFGMDEPDGIEHALAIYAAFKRWAVNMHATDFIVGTNTDVTAKELASVLGPVKMKQIWMAKVS